MSKKIALWTIVISTDARPGSGESRDISPGICLKRLGC